MNTGQWNISLFVTDAKRNGQKPRPWSQTVWVRFLALPLPMSLCNQLTSLWLSFLIYKMDR